MPKLTKRIVDLAVADPNGRQVLVWDSEVKGFALRITPSGVKSYILNYRTAEGRDRRYTIGKHGSPWTCEEARAKALAIQRDLAAGHDPLDNKAEARATMTVKELAALYLAEGPADKPNKKAASWVTDASSLQRHIVPLLGAKSIKTLSSAEIARFQMDVAAGKTAVDVKLGPRRRAIVTGGRGIAARSLAILGAMLQFAVNRHLIPTNPAKGVRLFKGEKMERFLTAREVTALADALAVMEEECAFHPSMAVAIRLLLLTGCRKNEIVTLRWEWVDWERNCLRLPDSKTGAKTVPMAAAAMKILSELERGDSPYVLPPCRGGARQAGHMVGVQKAWERLRVRATELARQRAVEQGEPVERAPDLSTVRLHDLRHSFASFAVADGATLYMVGKVLGHKQTRTTEIYAHLADDPLRAVADRTASKIAEAIKLGTEREKPKAEVVKPSPARKSGRG